MTLIDLANQNPCMLVQSVDGLVIVQLVLSPAVVRRSAAAVILVGDVDGDRLRLYLPPAPVIASFCTCGVTPTRTAALTASASLPAELPRIRLPESMEAVVR